MACDIHYKKVGLLLDFDGASGSNSFVDLSEYGNVLTPHGGAVVSTTAPKFGTGCLVTGSGEFLSTPAASGGPLDLSPGTYTIECWVKTNYTGTDTQYDFFLCAGTAFTSGVQVGIYENAGNPLIAVCVVNTAGGNTFLASGAPAINDGNWHAVCVEAYYDGSNDSVSIYVDGIRYVHGGVSALTLTAYTQILIGQDDTGRPFPGQIDELRITKGYARHRNGTYTVDTSAFGIACAGQQPVIPVLDEGTGVWMSAMTSINGVSPYTFEYDPPFFEDPDTNIAVLFFLSIALPTPGEIGASNIVATYGGQPCKALVQNSNSDAFFEGQRATIYLLCTLPPTSVFTSNILTLTVTGTTDVVSFFAYDGAVALLVDPSADLTPNVQTNSGSTSNPITLPIPALTLDNNWLMVSSINCAVSSPGNPSIVSTPAFHTDIDSPDSVPLAAGERQLTAGSETNAVTWEYAPPGPSAFQGFWGITLGLPPIDFGVEVPSVIGDLPADANTAIVNAGFVVGMVTSAPSNATPPGTVFFQNPAGGFFTDPGASVDYIIATGAAPAFVPNIVGETVAQGNSDITGAGFQVGSTSTASSDTVVAGLIISQSPAGGTQAALGTFVSYVISSGPTPPPPPTTGTKFNFEATVISQFANSPTLLQLCSNMNDYLDQNANFAAFFDYVWNVNTAQDFGLDIWGKIVNISRLLTIPNTARNFGFHDNVTPPDYDPFNVSPFNSKGGGATQTYLLNNAAYRTLILTKALSNISATTAPAINQLLRNLFPGRGRCYVLDLGGMAMQYTFEFQLTVTEFAILAQSKALPRPAGVSVNIVTLSGGSVLGFEEAGGSAESFGFGHFY